MQLLNLLQSKEDLCAETLDHFCQPCELADGACRMRQSQMQNGRHTVLSTTVQRLLLPDMPNSLDHAEENCTGCSTAGSCFLTMM